MKYLYGFRYMEETFYAEGSNPDEARQGLSPSILKKPIVLMMALPIGIGKITYVDVHGDIGSKTLKDWDAMWRSDKGHGRHER